MQKFRTKFFISFSSHEQDIFLIGMLQKREPQKYDKTFEVLSNWVPRFLWNVVLLCFYRATTRLWKMNGDDSYCFMVSFPGYTVGKPD